MHFCLMLVAVSAVGTDVCVSLERIVMEPCSSAGEGSEEDRREVQCAGGNVEQSTVRGEQAAQLGVHSRQ